MDVNTLRIAVTVAGLALFVVLMLHTWSRQRRAEHEAAAMLPFVDEDLPAASGQSPGSKNDSRSTP
jgi:cbb3-type cytochrome oxidase subunit 3